MEQSAIRCDDLAMRLYDDYDGQSFFIQQEKCYLLALGIE